MQLESIIDKKPLPDHRTALQVADRVGAMASFLCAIHCAALPFVFALLPLLGLEFLASHNFERIFIVCASLLATITLVHSYRLHRIRLPLLLLVPGLALLWTGGFIFDVHAGLNLHAVVVTIGGSCVALAHVLNMRIRRGQSHKLCHLSSANPAIV
ncbi:MAG TPA: MerC domain-containing protein [Rudaea sp.]|nr:MerC domain-containing protein [Rudaea sp.]